MRRPLSAKRTPHEYLLQQIAVCGQPESSLVGVPVRVDRRKMRPFFRQILQGENGRHRAHRNTSSTVDALDRADIELGFGLEFWLIFPRMDAVNRANIHA